MVYWLYEKNLGYFDWQIEEAIKKKKVQEKYTLLKDEDWNNIMQEAINKNMAIVNGPGNLPKLEPFPAPPPTYLLMQEKARIEKWLQEHDYIGIKIATGRATREEYESTIYEMNAKAARLNELNKILQEKN